MARIAGVDLPPAKRVVISLQYIYGIGNKAAHDIVTKAGVDLATRTKDLTEDQTRELLTLKKRLGYDDVRFRDEDCAVCGSSSFDQSYSDFVPQAQAFRRQPEPQQK